MQQMLNADKHVQDYMQRPAQQPEKVKQASPPPPPPPPPPPHICIGLGQMEAQVNHELLFSHSLTA